MSGNWSQRHLDRIRYLQSLLINAVGLKRARGEYGGLLFQLQNAERYLLLRISREMTKCLS